MKRPAKCDILTMKILEFPMVSGKNIEIAGKNIGPGEPVFIIAEAGVNHNGSLETAKQLIDVAAEAGADAVKFQTFTAENLVTVDAEQADYQSRNLGKKESQFTMLKRLELPYDFHPILQAYCRTKNIIFLSTPFSEPDADFLESLHLSAFKIPSGEITNVPYLAYIAKKKKPLIVSTGMADLVEVQTAVATIKAEGNDEIILLHSTSNYPPSPESLNLSAITTLYREFSVFNIPVGYSDNGSPGYVADVMAVALGACVIEKHFTLDKSLAGPDHLASMDPLELKELVLAIRLAERMRGTGVKQSAPEEAAIMAVARKSIVANNDIALGSIISKTDLSTRRPGTGLPPAEISVIVGKTALRFIKQGDLLSREDYD